MATPVRIVMSTSRVPRPGTVIHVTQQTGTQSVTVPAAKKTGTGEAKSALNVIKKTPAARVKARSQHAAWILIRESYAITVPLASEEIDAVCVRMVAREKTAISVKQITSQKRARRRKYARYTAILPQHATDMVIVAETGSAFVNKAGLVMIIAACQCRSKSKGDSHVLPICRHWSRESLLARRARATVAHALPP